MEDIQRKFFSYCGMATQPIALWQNVSFGDFHTHAANLSLEP